jgi:hypothetical protein
MDLKGVNGRRTSRSKNMVRRNGIESFSFALTLALGTLDDRDDTGYHGWRKSAGKGTVPLVWYRMGRASAANPLVTRSEIHIMIDVL